MRSLHRPIYESRTRALVSAILPHLPHDARVLDIGCGFGTLAKALADADPSRRLVVEGLERVRRDGEAIPVTAYDGRTAPFADNTFDAVILADVLHHEPDPDRLLDEAARITKRFLIIKDHAPQALLAQQRISLIDWAANAPYGVPCLFRYFTPAQWRTHFSSRSLRLVEERLSMNLYPPIVNLLFGRRLQYLAIAEKPATEPRST
ncbi:MAG: class I SAM-dependent methyltransferase [Phycisphaerales bacterium]